jgi:hypothetical protein
MDWAMKLIIIIPTGTDTAAAAKMMSSAYCLK